MSALRGDSQVAAQEIFSNNVIAQGTDLGGRITAGDGRVYRYALGSATAFVAGKVYQALPQDTTNWQGLGVAVAAGTGTFTVTTGSTVTLAANLMAGGILTERSSTGKGFTYRIKSHPAITAGTVTFTLEDPIQANIPTTGVIDVTPNPYAGLIVAPTALTGIPVGVAVQNGTATGYAWIQTRGQCNVLSDGAITVGRPVTPSINVSGALMAQTSGTQAVVGYAMVTTTDTKYQPFFLTFE